MRSNRIPLVIAARVDGLTGPVGGPYTVSGDGFAPADTTVSLGGIQVTPSSTTATAISFALPTSAPPAGVYPVRIVVNGVPCLPGPVVTL